MEAGQGPLLGSLRPCSSLDTGLGGGGRLILMGLPWVNFPLAVLQSLSPLEVWGPVGVPSVRGEQSRGRQAAEASTAPTSGTSSGPGAHPSTEIPGRRQRDPNSPFWVLGLFSLPRNSPSPPA